MISSELRYAYSILDYSSINFASQLSKDNLISDKSLFHVKSILIEV